MHSSSDPHFEARQAMVEEQLKARGIRASRVLNAMLCVPRHEFVAESFQRDAYGDYPLGIGEGQTISQPFIVARMLELLALQPSQVILEIGTGSGYLTALLANLSHFVYSIERHQSLAKQAEETLTRLGYLNLTVIVGDGSLGWPAHAPYDAIVVSAAAPAIPKSLFEQLADGGPMVIPVGPPDCQELQLVRKQNGSPIVQALETCRFVPLIQN